MTKGVVGIQYHAGVNGGLVQTQVHANLLDQAPTLQEQTQITDVKATEEVRPQIALFFPGNIVQGLFSREQHISLPLREALANLIDPRFVMHPVGTGRTRPTGRRKMT